MDDPNEPDVLPFPTDVIPRADWDGFMTLPTDVVLKTTSYEGSWASSIHRLASDWIWACPMDPQSAPFMHAPSLTAHEEFDGVVFNAVHGYFRQALGCLRNVLETMTAAAAMAVTNNTTKFIAWQNGADEIPMREARPLLRDSAEGRRIEAAVAADSIFGNDSTHWIKRRYAELCAYWG